MATFVFRADANVQIGGGHVLRSLVLAKRLASRGHICIFISVEESFNFVPVSTAGVNVVEIKKSEFNNVEMIKHIYDRQAANAIVVDSYQLDFEFETTLSSFFPKVIVFDDMPSRRHNADVLIDPTLGRKSSEYERFVDENCLLLLGPEYAPMREEFSLLRDLSIGLKLQDSPRNLLISYGLTDPENLTLRTLKTLKTFLPEHKLTLDIVIGNGTPTRSEIIECAKTLKDGIKIHTNVEKMAELMLHSDIIIGSPGSSSWERCCMGIPSILTSVAQNQIQIGEKLQEYGCAIYLGRFQEANHQNLLGALESLLMSDSIRTNMIHSAAKVCTGLGSVRISERLEDLTSEGNDKDFK